jgi:hypothetical protein
MKEDKEKSLGRKGAKWGREGTKVYAEHDW